MLVYDLRMERKRKTKSLTVDSAVWNAVQSQATRQGISISRWVENFLFDSLQRMGLIDIEVLKLGEIRGGDRRSHLAASQKDEKAKSQKNKSQQETIYGEDFDGTPIAFDILSNEELEQAEKLRKEVIAAEKARVKRLRKEYIDNLIAEGVDPGEVHLYMYQFDPYEGVYPEES